MNRSQQPVTFKQIQILFFALLAGQVMIGAVLFFVLTIDGVESSAGGSVFKFIIPVAVFGSISASVFINRYFGEQAGTQANLQAKLQHFRTRNLFRWAVQEAGNLVAIVLAALDANTLLMFWFAFGAMAFAMARPSLDKFLEEYQLTNAERQELELNP
ncbi:MAG: hypothetical protein HY842_05735 [Bacteroidetes bacterium]|nr:hypothetical protein [Bacteroidota bacterium]